MFEAIFEFLHKDEPCFKTPEHHIAVLEPELSGVDIELTEEEFDQACQVACRRCRDAYTMGLKDSYINGREYDSHIQGCASEIAVAKYFEILDQWKPTINTFRSMPDIKINKTSIEVKSLGNKDTILKKGFSIKQSTLKRTEEDVFIFVWCDIRQNNKPFICKILGWATHDEILAKYNAGDWKFPVNDLRCIRCFNEFLNKE